MKVQFKIERFLFYVLIFLVPLQVRKILIVWATPAHIFNEWSAAFLYVTDLLIILLLAFWYFRAKRVPFSWKKLSKTDWALAVFGIISVSSILAADNKQLGLFRLIKLAEMIGLYYYVSFSVGKTFEYPRALTIIMFSGLWQAGMAVAQALKQSSLGLMWMGESVLRTNFQGVAVVPTFEGTFLRAYGSLPHPNILAAWLFLAVFSFYFWYLYQKENRPLWAVVLIYIPLLWGFLFTFSRVAIGLWVGGAAVRTLLVLLRRRHYHIDTVFLKRIRDLVLLSVVGVLIFSYFYWPQVQARIHISSEEQAVTQRIAYNKIAGTVMEKNPWLGVGTGQFVWNMFKEFRGYPTYFYQPVHNIFLLISSENGLLGMATFLAFIVFLIHRYTLVTKLTAVWQLSFLIVFLSVLIMGLFDHFLWTIQQGQIMFWLLLAFINARFLEGKKVL